MDSNWWPDWEKEKIGKYELFLRIRTGDSTGDKYEIDRRKLLLDRASHLSEQKQIDGCKLFLDLN